MAFLAVKSIYFIFETLKHFEIEEGLHTLGFFKLYFLGAFFLGK
jgi:hypothetical protein